MNDFEFWRKFSGSVHVILGQCRFRDTIKNISDCFDSLNFGEMSPMKKKRENSKSFISANHYRISSRIYALIHDIVISTFERTIIQIILHIGVNLKNSKGKTCGFVRYKSLCQI